MASDFIRTNEDGWLLCPACEGEAIHVEIVYVAARTEDGPFNEITVNAVTGRVETHGDLPAPAGPTVREGRRQRIAVTGWCETCGHAFAIVFTQHKGVTYVEAVMPIPHATNGGPESVADPAGEPTWQAADAPGFDPWTDAAAIDLPPEGA